MSADHITFDSAASSFATGNHTLPDTRHGVYNGCNQEAEYGGETLNMVSGETRAENFIHRNIMAGQPKNLLDSPELNINPFDCPYEGERANS